MQGVHLVFPFVDLLGDGYSSFAYEEYLFVSANNPIAIAGTESYGIKAVPACFDPPVEAYAASHRYNNIYLKAFTSNATHTPTISAKYTPKSSIGPWPLDL